MVSVLIVEDNKICAECLFDIIEENGWNPEIASTMEQANLAISTKKFDVILLDLNLEGQDGFKLLDTISRLRLDSKTIMISGSMGVSETVKAMKLGAWHCFPKPINSNELIKFLRNVASSLAVANEPKESESKVDLIGVSEPMLKVKQTLRQVSKGKKTTVIITGETGTGKEVVARRLHNTARGGKPFVAVNCSAIPASLIESELFGHEKGAFTDARSTRRGVFEMAGEGTLFLDEIGDLPIEYQGKLLRALQERSFRRVGGTQEIPLQATVVAATNVDLAEAVRQGKFREDLYYRLSVIPVHLPPLRERGNDVLLIADSFLKHIASENDCKPPVLSDAEKQMLLSHPWPGNIRELRNVMERYFLFGRLEFSSPKQENVKHVDCAEIQITAPVKGGLNGLNPDEERLAVYSFLLKKLMAEETSRQMVAGYAE